MKNSFEEWVGQTRDNLQIVQQDGTGSTEKFVWKGVESTWKFFGVEQIALDQEEDLFSIGCDKWSAINRDGSIVIGGQHGNHREDRGPSTIYSDARFSGSRLTVKTRCVQEI